MAIVSSADAIPAGTAAGFSVEGKPIAVANVDGQMFAFDDECTHFGCPLSDGDLDGTQITCLCHMSVFEVTDGAVVSGPAEVPVRTYPVEVVDGEVSIKLDAPQ